MQPLIPPTPEDLVAAQLRLAAAKDADDEAQAAMRDAHADATAGKKELKSALRDWRSLVRQMDAIAGRRSRGPAARRHARGGGREGALIRALLAATLLALPASGVAAQEACRPTVITAYSVEQYPASPPMAHPRRATSASS